MIESYQIARKTDTRKIAGRLTRNIRALMPMVWLIGGLKGDLPSGV